MNTQTDLSQLKAVASRIREMREIMGWTAEEMAERKDRKCVTLIGMPAAGKSTVGVLLAKRIGYRFIDGDLLIQEQEKKLLREIIAERGVDGFLEVEERVNASIADEHAVIATGGSVVYGKKAMEHLQSIGRIVYLKLPYEQLQKRLGNLKNRGVVLKDGQDLQDLFAERSPLYERYADITVDETGLDMEETLSAVLEQIRQADDAGC